MKKIILICFTIMLSMYFVTPVYAEDPKWIMGFGDMKPGKSCPQICNEKGLYPVAAGIYKNGNKFYICAANVKGEGFRPGYNLSPTWSTKCTVGWGGDEVSAWSYYCLCHEKNIFIEPKY